MTRPIPPHEVAAQLRGHPLADRGNCDDCKRNVNRRIVYGKFTICAPCAVSRVAAGRKAKA